MNIIKYKDYFCDGTLLDVEHGENQIDFFLESAEVDPEEIEDELVLSKENRIKGKLSLKNVTSLKIENEPYLSPFIKEYDDGEILDFNIQGDELSFLIEWKNFPPKARSTKISKIEVKAKKVEWEDIPDLD